MVEVLEGRGVMVLANVVVSVIVGVKVSVSVGEAVFVIVGDGVTGVDALHATTFSMIKQDNKMNRILGRR